MLMRQHLDHIHTWEGEVESELNKQRDRPIIKSYANGLMDFASEVVGRTEQFSVLSRMRVKSKTHILERRFSGIR